MNEKTLDTQQPVVNEAKVKALQNTGNRKSRRMYGKRSGFTLSASLSKKERKQ